ncbi:hypothetical protein WN55_10298 [Dufourea novaeangliae]|uniref:Protein anoxia up-regulated n=1 Tax=Dufourea novaeangliae TaxID=178035 RepID=A0A154P5C8_DUFNO|nr:hypothetical protein WN55_10298 [Dufourea novaeangliae]
MALQTPSCREALRITEGRRVCEYTSVSVLRLERMLETPRHYVVRDYPEVGVRAAQEQYSYAYTNTSSSSSSSATDPYSRRPQRTSFTEENVVKRESGPYGAYSTERSSRTSTVYSVAWPPGYTFVSPISVPPN